MDESPNPVVLNINTQKSNINNQLDKKINLNIDKLNKN